MVPKLRGIAGLHFWSLTTDEQASIIEMHRRGREESGFWLLTSKDTGNMRDVISEHSQLRPKPSKAETKADITDHAARAIIGAEAERREAKTARLRRARLEADGKLAAAPPTAKQRPAGRRKIK